MDKNKNESEDIPLTEDQIVEIREVLAKYKIPQFGGIQQFNACVAMHDLGVMRTEAEVTLMFEEFELEPAELITEEQFLHVMTKTYQQLYNKESLMAAFKFFDTDNNRTIRASELRNTAKNMGANYTDTEFEEMFQEADLDHDGNIGWEDFFHAVNNP